MEEVLEKYSREDKKEAYKGRGEALEWQIINTEREICTGDGRRLVGENLLLAQVKQLAAEQTYVKQNWRRSNSSKNDDDEDQGEGQNGREASSS